MKFVFIFLFDVYVLVVKTSTLLSKRTQCAVHIVSIIIHKLFIPRKVSTHSWFSKWANLISHSIKYKPHTHNNCIKRIFCWMSNRYIDKILCQMNATKSQRIPHIFAHLRIDGSPLVERNRSIQKTICICLSFWWDAFILSHHSTSQLVNLSSGEWLTGFGFFCFSLSIGESFRFVRYSFYPFITINFDLCLSD